MTEAQHQIGLLLGTERDWPRAFTEILRRLGPVDGADGTRHVINCDAVTIEPPDNGPGGKRVSPITTEILLSAIPVRLATIWDRMV